MSDHAAFPVPRSAEAITQLLRHINLDVPDRAGYLAISQSEGSRFAEAVAKVANKEKDAEAVLEYVRNVVAAAHPNARAAVSMTGFEGIQPIDLIDIAKKEGRSFRNALRLVLSGSERSEQATALAYLQNLIEEYGVGSSDFCPCPEPESPPLMATPSDCLSDVTNIRDFRQGLQPPAGAPFEPAVKAIPPTQEKWGESFHVYAGKAALCFSECKTKQDEKATVMIEAAKSNGDMYAWADKILVMLTISELPLVLGFFLGYLELLEIKGHGKQQEKAVTFANQGNQFFVTVLMRGHPPRAVPIPPKDSYTIITMFLRQMLKNDPFLSSALVMQLSKRICEMHVAKRSQSVVVNG